MNDGFTTSAADSDDRENADLPPMPFFAVVPDAFMEGVQAASPPRGDLADCEEDDATMPLGWDRWSF